MYKIIGILVLLSFVMLSVIGFIPYFDTAKKVGSTHLYMSRIKKNEDLFSQYREVISKKNDKTSEYWKKYYLEKKDNINGENDKKSESLISSESLIDSRGIVNTEGWDKYVPEIGDNVDINDVELFPNPEYSLLEGRLKKKIDSIAPNAERDGIIFAWKYTAGNYISISLLISLLISYFFNFINRKLCIIAPIIIAPTAIYFFASAEAFAGLMALGQALKGAALLWLIATGVYFLCMGIISKIKGENVVNSVKESNAQPVTRNKMSLSFFLSLCWVVGIVLIVLIVKPYGPISWMEVEELTHMFMVIFAPLIFFFSARHVYLKYVR